MGAKPLRRSSSRLFARRAGNAAPRGRHVGCARARRREQAWRSVRGADCQRPEVRWKSQIPDPKSHIPRKAVRMTTIERLHDLLAKRILLLDGAMGTMIQRHRLTEAEF